MKKILYQAVLFVSLTAILVGCKKDEVNAPVPVDGLSAVTGFNRAKVEFTVPSDAVTGKVFYGTGNFVAFTVVDPNAIQSVIVEGLNEEEQFLRVVSINADGKTSDPRAVKLKVYGSSYEGTLTPRKWANQIANSATSVALTFEEAIATEMGVRVVFTSTSGAKDSVLMSNTATSINIDNIDTAKTAYYYSVYKPYAEAIDMFKSSSVDLKEALTFNFAKEGWVINGSSSEAPGKEAGNLIDNNINSSWQSAASSSYPHWVVVDMGSQKTIDGFYYVNNQAGGSAARKLKFEVSNDNTTWRNVLEADVADSYLRQRLALDQTTMARYFKVTLVSSWDATATTATIGEIDAYNLQNISAENGIDSYVNATPVELANAKAPFVGDGSDLFSPVGANRMQKVTGWTHNPNAYVTFDGNDPSAITFFIAPVWGLSEVQSGKIYQTVNLQPGKYSLKTRVGTVDGPVEAYAVVTTSASLPDITAVATDAGTIKYVDLAGNANKTVETVFELTTASTVRIGFVCNIFDQYGSKGIPWSSFGIKEVNLIKVP